TDCYHFRAKAVNPVKGLGVAFPPILFCVAVRDHRVEPEPDRPTRLLHRRGCREPAAWQRCPLLPASPDMLRGYLGSLDLHTILEREGVTTPPRTARPPPCVNPTAPT